MADQILAISERGQVTIPKKLREKIPVKFFICRVKDNAIVLEPLQTKEEFLEEVETAEKDWEKHGGKTLNEIKKEYHL